MVGHTHEDVDQLFSCISRPLSKINALTIPELMEEIHSSYTPAIVVHLLSCTFDVKMWMDEVAEKDLSGHVEQHQFKVSRNVIGQTESVF